MQQIQESNDSLVEGTIYYSDISTKKYNEIILSNFFNYHVFLRYSFVVALRYPINMCDSL